MVLPNPNDTGVDAIDVDEEGSSDYSDNRNVEADKNYASAAISSIVNVYSAKYNKPALLEKKQDLFLQCTPANMNNPELILREII